MAKRTSDRFNSQGSTVESCQQLGLLPQESGLRHAPTTLAGYKGGLVTVSAK